MYIYTYVNMCVCACAACVCKHDFLTPYTSASHGRRDLLHPIFNAGCV